jgi:hypothetical protein
VQKNRPSRDVLQIGGGIWQSRCAGMRGPIVWMPAGRDYLPGDSSGPPKCGGYQQVGDLCDLSGNSNKMSLMRLTPARFLWLAFVL